MPPASVPFDDQLARTFRASRYAERMCAADPGLPGRLDGAPAWTRADMADALPGGDDEKALHAALRRLRREVMVRLIHRDINGHADLAEAVGTATTLAEVTVAAAQAFHARALSAAWGLADPASDEAGLLTIGMGKLGGAELNVSSDIDLIFVHRADGEATGKKSWHEFHCELGKRIIRALDPVDEHGFVFRVDMRLRPFGASGPLVSSLDALEQYFYSQARPWERYAWLKARALTGPPAVVAEWERLTTPFVYRRYHDYAAIEEMRELHGQIRAEAARKNRLDDIKVGVGGIREVEFVAQLFQLIRGGREPDLQTRSTREALAALAARGLIPADRVAALLDAYTFLRNLEHRLQYLDDQQTQMLPQGDGDRARIAEAMGFPGWDAFLPALDRHRRVVTREFESLFAQPEAPAAAPAAGPDLPARLRATAHEDADAAARRVEAWLAASRTQTLSAKARARMESLLPAAWTAALRHARPLATFQRLCDLLDAIDRRETYLALLVEYPQVLDRVARLAAESAWAADFLRRHPILLDELITPPARQAGLDWVAERRHLQAACDAASGDVERQYEILRHAKQVATLKLNLADVEGRLSVMALSDELTALADLLVDTALVLAWRAMTREAALSWAPPPGFGVIGYGKLGSKELGYASDLDLVFVTEPAAGAEPERTGRLAQRLVSWLNTMTAGGVLYETDLRLRPDGDAGVIAPTLTAFRDYQRTRAWTWEHQALTRARFCAGDPALAAPFEAVRREILSLPRDRVALRAEIVAMRDKMRAEKKDRADRIDLKHTRGGIVDVEFIVQYLILAWSHEHPEFLGNLGNFALLARAAALGILDESLATRVGKAYLVYRERQHRARNNNEEKTWIATDEYAAEREAVRAAWKGLFG